MQIRSTLPLTLENCWKIKCIWICVVSKKEVFYYNTSEGYEVDFITKDQEGHYEMIQVVWDQSDHLTFAREERALKSAEKELGIKGRIIDWEQYLKFHDTENPDVL